MITVYVCFDDENRIRFVGRTSHVSRRSVEWTERGRTLVDFVTVERLDEARGVEQVLIEKLQGRRGGLDPRHREALVAKLERIRS